MRIHREYVEKLRTPEQAVQVVKSGDWIDYGTSLGFPMLLDAALAKRKEELLDVLARKVKESGLLKNSTIVLDGFTGFTPVQLRLLRELMIHCRDVVITVMIDKKENPYIYKTPYQLFALSKQMVTKLVQIAKDFHSSVQLKNHEHSGLCK